jgi:magnesium chelatase subunit I
LTFAYVNKTGSRSQLTYPFSAIVGQEEMKRALMLAAIDPAIGGILVLGDRGTGKSTAVRGLAGLLPSMAAIEGCRYNCDPRSPSSACDTCRSKRTGRALQIPVPVVDLPLGATEDRIVGALDLERALLKGEKTFEPGLLAAAHRGFLYIDEVNLLDDHLVDLLLDVAASGTNVVEREGISIRHPARFVLVGSGNPEEGELRPQLLDRFGLSVDVASPADIALRVEVVRRRDAFDRDPAAFHRRWRGKDGALKAAVARAQALVPSVETSDEALEFAARLCMKLGVDGLRGELTLIRAGRAQAALAGRERLGVDDLISIAPSALRHRLRRDPLDEAGSAARIERAIRDVAES